MGADTGHHWKNSVVYFSDDSDPPIGAPYIVPCADSLNHRHYWDMGRAMNAVKVERASRCYGRT